MSKQRPEEKRAAELDRLMMALRKLCIEIVERAGPLVGCLNHPVYLESVTAHLRACASWLEEGVLTLSEAKALIEAAEEGGDTSEPPNPNDPEAWGRYVSERLLGGEGGDAGNVVP